MRALLLACLLSLALVACGRTPPPKQDAPGAPPPDFRYQMRDAAPPGARTAAGRNGEALYSNHCGFCHLPGGFGTNVLTPQMLAASRPPTDGLLENRTDLEADYVKQVVRAGKNAMPPLTRVDVTDAELDSIAAYLARSGAR